VYADWLLERGDARGELIRLQCALAALQKNDPQRAELEPRVARLIADFGPRIAGTVAEHASGYSFARGFVSEVTMTAGGFRKHGGRFFREHPVDALRLRPVDEASVAKLASCPELGLVRRLSLGAEESHEQRYARLAGFAGCRYFDALEHLDLSHCITDPMDWEHFLDGLMAPRLRSIDLSWAFASPRCLRSIARNPNLPRLEELRFDRISVLADHERPGRRGARVPAEFLVREEDAPAILQEAFELLADSPTVKSLKRLRLGGSKTTSADVARLVAGANAERLEELFLDDCWFVTDDGLRAIAASSRLRALQRLSVRSTRTTDAGLEALLASSHLSSLRTLSLFWNLHVWDGYGPASAERIAALLLALPSSHPLAEVNWEPMHELPTRAALVARYRLADDRPAYGACA
jgi:hypothetical protein